MDSRFEAYLELLVKWNERVNLTAIVDPAEIRVKHFEDSLTVLPHIPQGASVIDVGSGAGFPGLPVAMARADVSVTLLEATGKRVAFLNEAIGRLGVSNARTVNARAEEAGKLPEFRERYDIAIARAVAALPALAEMCLPFVKIGGAFIAMKAAWEEELEAAGPLIAALGGEVREVRGLELSDGSARSIIVIAKTAETPPRFPRRAARLGRPVK